MPTTHGRARRDLLATLGGAVGIAALGGCVTPRPTNGPHARPLSRAPFVAPRVSMDRVVRVITGLRPYRPAGFVVRRIDYDARRTVIHNYGHGGGGISLSWGSSALAVREAAGLPPGEAAVIGAGVMGLTTARLLQDAGWSVTIYTRDMPRHSTSNVAAGQWSPTSVFVPDRVDAAFEARFVFAARIAHHAFQNLVGPRYGVSFLENYFLSDAPQAPDHFETLLEGLYFSQAVLGPGEHPFPTPYARRVVTMQVQPAIFLRQVRDDFLLAGGHFVVRDFQRVDDVLSLPQRVVFNCTGLGAAELFEDEELKPAKGQLVFVPPDPAVDFASIATTRGLLYMFPRTGELVLGGSFEVGNWDRAPDPAITERIVEGHRELYAAMA